MRVDCREGSVRISLGGVARLSLGWSKPLGRPAGKYSFVRGGEARLERGGRSTVIARERQEAFASATAAKFQEFVARIKNGETDNAEARHARALIGLVEAGYESARTNRTVFIANK